MENTLTLHIPELERLAQAIEAQSAILAQSAGLIPQNPTQAPLGAHTAPVVPTLNQQKRTLTQKAPCRRIERQGGKNMPKNYTHKKAFEKEMTAMKAEGKTNREIAEHFGFRDKNVVKAFFKRKNASQRRIKSGDIHGKKGRPRKRAFSAEEEKDYEIKQLRMENKLLRDFLHLAGRR